VFVQFWLEGGDNAELDAISGALAAEGHPVIVVDVEDAYDLGREFFRWEFGVAVAGHVLGTNPFDEPNVQESKDNTNRVLQEFERTRALDIPGIDGVRPPLAISPNGVVHQDLQAAVTTLVRALQPHDYFAITAYMHETQEADEIFADIRGVIRDAYGIATTLGYGPRFLHSTGQLHKGGPPEGVFLQVTVGDPEDLAIPGKPFTFGQLKRAQGIGDLQSLAKRGRPVIRLHLGREIEPGLLKLREAITSAATRPAEGARR
jgi:hypothetical protein